VAFKFIPISSNIGRKILRCGIFFSLVALPICFLNKKTGYHSTEDKIINNIIMANTTAPLMFLFFFALFPSYLSTDTNGSFQTSSLHYSVFTFLHCRLNCIKQQCRELPSAVFHQSDQFLSTKITVFRKSRRHFLDSQMLSTFDIMLSSAIISFHRCHWHLWVVIDESDSKVSVSLQWVHFYRR
jgi:hypothetical protein